VVKAKGIKTCLKILVDEFKCAGLQMMNIFCLRHAQTM